MAFYQVKHLDLDFYFIIEMHYVYEKSLLPHKKFSIKFKVLDNNNS